LACASCPSHHLTWSSPVWSPREASPMPLDSAETRQFRPSLRQRHSLAKPASGRSAGECRRLSLPAAGTRVPSIADICHSRAKDCSNFCTGAKRSESEANRSDLGVFDLLFLSPLSLSWIPGCSGVGLLQSTLHVSAILAPCCGNGRHQHGRHGPRLTPS
jgi:hypothetical protein